MCISIRIEHVPLLIHIIQMFYVEMPGLILLRKRNANDRPLEGAKIVGCTHVTAKSAVSFNFFNQDTFPIGEKNHLAFDRVKY